MARIIIVPHRNSDLAQACDMAVRQGEAVIWALILNEAGHLRSPEYVKADMVLIDFSWLSPMANYMATAQNITGRPNVTEVMAQAATSVLGPAEMRASFEPLARRQTPVVVIGDLPVEILRKDYNFGLNIVEVISPGRVYDPAAIAAVVERNLEKKAPVAVSGAPGAFLPAAGGFGGAPGHAIRLG